MSSSAIALAAAVVASWAAICPAQIAVADAAPAAGAATSTRDKPVASFTLPLQTTDVKEALDDFKRFVEHEAWEKAFKSLETISSKSSSGFIERDDGVLIPSRMIVRSLLASLPPAGKSAYRVFYDAQAMALWDKATGGAELENLSNIVNNHLVSSVGDRAADRLGDLHFERGDLDQAVVAWRSVLDYCPDSKLSKAQLLVKVGTALARAARSSELSDVERSVRERFESEAVEVGGRRVAAGEQIGRLVSTVKADRPAAVAKLRDDFALPTSDEPIWQFRYQTKDDPANATQPFALTDVYGRIRANDFPIPAATDGQRVYANIFGVEMAFDLTTGKMLWRTGRLHQLQFQQNRQGAAPERYSIVVSGDRTWSVTRDPQQVNQSPPVFSLVARDSATGKEVFNSRKTLSNWNIVGMPCMGNVQVVSRPPATVAARVADSTTAAGTLDFSQGFAKTAGQLKLNGKAALVNSRLRLTDGGSSQKSSVFSEKPINISGFKAQFEFQFTKAFADGMMFVMQGEGSSALGRPGDGMAFENITKSVGVKFDLYGKDANSTGLCLEGAHPEPDGAIGLADSKIDLKNGHVFKVDMNYDGASLDVTITDTETKASHQQSYPVDIPQMVGGPAAYVGFTASTGGLTAVQEVLNWTYASTPPQKRPTLATTGGVIYVGASRTNQSRELAVLVLNAVDGKLLKTINIGTHVVDPNQLYYDRGSEPSFLLYRDRLYVDTHAGALVSLQPQAGTIDWGILYESPPPQTGYYYYNYQPPQHAISGPMFAGGLLFAKGMRSPRLVGVRSDGPALVWNRPVETSAVMAGADEDYLFLGGNELTAYSLKTQDLLWSAQLPHTVVWSVPVFTKNRLYQFTSRGIYEVDKHTGRLVKLFRGSDLDAMGGSLFVTDKALVTVSNLAITAYPLPASASATKTE